MGLLESWLIFWVCFWHTSTPCKTLWKSNERKTKWLQKWWMFSIGGVISFFLMWSMSMDFKEGWYLLGSMGPVVSLIFPEYIYIYIFLTASVAYQFIFLCISKWHEWNSGNLWASLTEIIVNKTLNQAFLWIARMFTTTIKWSSQIMVSSHSYSKASKGKKIIFRMYNMSALVCFNMQHHDIILMCWTCDLLLIWFLIL